MKKFVEIKKNAKAYFLKHYFLFVILMVIASFLGSNSQKSLSLFSANTSSIDSAWSVVKLISEGDISGATDAALGNKEALSKVDHHIGAISFGHQKGVLSDFVNYYASGSFWAALASTILALTRSNGISRILISVLALLFIGFEVIFVSEIFKVIYTRVFLETRIYKRFNVSTLIFLFRTKTWFKASLAYFRYNIYMFLWSLTIVGGIIKYHSYAMVKYILAENPSISGKDAITLSRRMMDGHKWEFFLFRLTFIGWRFLSTLTGGLLDIFFLNPYYTASETEYFAYIRKLAKDNRIEGIDMLNDQYLYKKAPAHEIKDAYADALAILEETPVILKQSSKLRAFFQDTFGLVLTYDAQEEEYRKEMSRKATVNSYKYCINQEAYPVRLCPLPIIHSRKHLEHTYYIRHYSLSSLVMIFFTFCFVGWLWEVSIHIVKDGQFVNRGVLHGPWLPIYGAGAVLVLLALYRLRRHVLWEFASTILLSGIVEYFTSYALSVIHNGQKWWDYTGYFLNINGRVCAEGLLVFGLAGTAAVYFIAPMLDNVYSKIRIDILRTICVILLIIFAADFVYSNINPNTGKGITDYDVSEADNAYRNEMTDLDNAFLNEIQNVFLSEITYLEGTTIPDITPLGINCRKGNSAL